MPSDAPCEHASLRLGALLATTSGFLDAFTFVGHHGVFCTAMTGNAVLIGVDLVNSGFGKMGLALPAVLAFLLGVLAAQLLLATSFGKRLPDPHRSCILVEVVFLAACSWYPAGWDDVELVAGLSFVAAVQSGAFTRLGPWSYNSVVTTTNLRNFAQSLFAATWLGESEARARAWNFGVVSVCFVIGALAGGFGFMRLGNHALLLAAFALGAACLPPRPTEARPDRARPR